MIEYNLLPAQKQFLEIPHEYKTDIALYQGGYGSGKTFSGSLLGTLMCLRYPNIRGLVGAQTYSLVRDTTLVSYMEHLEKMKVKYKFNKSEGLLEFANGSTILFRHLEEPDKIKSLNLGFVEIEEMSDVPKSTFDMLLGRLRQQERPEWKNFRYRLFGHTNPESRKGWIYDYFVNNPEPNFRRVMAPTTDNIYLPDGFVDNMRNTYSDEYFRVNVLGEDCNHVQGLVTKNFSNRHQVKADLKIKDGMPIHIACDFNRDPMCWYVIQHYDGNINVLYELVQPHTTTEHCGNIIAEVLQAYKERPIILNGDASGKSETTLGSNFVILRNCLLRSGFTNVEIRVMNKNPDIGWRVDCWNNMIYGPDKKHHIFFHPQCKWAIYNCENLETEEGGSRPKKISSGKLRSDERAKYLGHPFDAISYVVCLYYPIKDANIRDYQGVMNDVFGNKYTYGGL